MFPRNVAGGFALQEVAGWVRYVGVSLCAESMQR